MIRQNLPSAPPAYDVRDQNETRRLVERAFASLSDVFASDRDVLTLRRRTTAVAVALSDVPNDGDVAIHVNSATGAVTLAYNRAGALRTIAFA